MNFNYVFSSISECLTAKSNGVPMGETLINILSRYKNNGIYDFHILTNPLSDSVKKIEDCMSMNIFKKNGFDHYMDSGGFQLKRGTFRKKIKSNDQAKTISLNCQADYADYGFCFDHQPKNKLNTNRNEFLDCIKKTISELDFHLKLFKEKQTKCKIFPILHCPTDMVNETLPMLLQNVSVEDRKKHFQGVSYNTMYNTKNIFRHLEKMLIVKDCLFKEGLNPHIHVLALFSLKFFLFLFLLKLYNPNFFKGITLSFDASTIYAQLARWGSVVDNFEHITMSEEPERFLKVAKKFKDFTYWVGDTYKEYAFVKDERNLVCFEPQNISKSIPNTDSTVLTQLSFYFLLDNFLKESLQMHERVESFKNQLTPYQTDLLKELAFIDNHKDFVKWFTMDKVEVFNLPKNHNYTYAKNTLDSFLG